MAALGKMKIIVATKVNGDKVYEFVL